MLAAPSNNSRNAQARTSFAHDMLCKENFEVAGKVMNNVTGFRAHAHSFNSDLLFFSGITSLPQQTKRVENVKANLES